MEDSTIALSPFISPFFSFFFFLFWKCQGKSVWAGLVLCCAEISNFSAPFPACLPACHRGAGAGGLRGHRARRADSGGRRRGERREQGRRGRLAAGRAGREERHLPRKLCQGVSATTSLAVIFFTFLLGHVALAVNYFFFLFYF